MDTIIIPHEWDMIKHFSMEEISLAISNLKDKTCPEKDNIRN